MGFLGTRIIITLHFETFDEVEIFSLQNHSNLISICLTFDNPDV